MVVVDGVAVVVGGHSLPKKRQFYLLVADNCGLGRRWHNKSLERSATASEATTPTPTLTSIAELWPRSSCKWKDELDVGTKQTSERQAQRGKEVCHAVVAVAVVVDCCH